MKYSILSPHLHSIADSAEQIIKERYTHKKAIIETQISPKIGWTPTLHWVTKTGYIACEVSERPFPIVLTQLWAEIISTGLPIKIISAYPVIHSLSPKDFQIEINRAKKFGIGLLSAEESMTGQIEYPGVSISLHLPMPDYKKYKSSIHDEIKNAFEMYMNGEPKHGVQELGQIFENIIVNLAVQAKGKSELKSGGFNNPSIHYPLNTLIQDLITDKIIDKKFLKKCAAFADDRNGTSHKAKDLNEAKFLEGRLKNSFTDGLFILEDFPNQLKKEGYKFIP